MSRPTSSLRDWLISLAITLILLLALNLLMVHYASGVVRQPHFPRTLLKSLDPCYQTFYHDTHGDEFRDWTAVTGDSYAAGSGDEFLDGKADYGIFPKLRSLTNGNYFVFGRGGFGSINAAKELMLCMKIFNGSFLLPKVEAPQELIFLFYEGNDLDNNFDHLQYEGNGQPVRQFVRDQVSHPDGASLRALDMHLPLFDLIKGQFSQIGRMLRGRGEKESHAMTKLDYAGPGEAGGNHAIVGGAVRPFPADPQGASVELAGRLDAPLQVFFESVLALKEYLPDTRITIVYVPSVVTTYAWQDPIRVQAYHTDAPVLTTNGDNEAQSQLIRESVARFAASNDFGFVDPTQALRSAAAVDYIHGPRDPRHFDATGYWIVARSIAASIGATTTPGPASP